MDTITISYVDDTLIVAVGNTVETMQNRTSATLDIVSGYIQNLSLRLAVEKTKAVVFRNLYGPVGPRLWIQGQAITLGAILKYLGVVLENKELIFGEVSDDCSHRTYAECRWTPRGKEVPADERHTFVVIVRRAEVGIFSLI